MLISREENFEVVSLNESKYFSMTQGDIEINQKRIKVKLLSTPHLSRYKIDAKGKEYGDAYDVRPALEWIKKELLNT